MAKPAEDRRSGKDRRRSSGTRAGDGDRRRMDRRQFPPPDDPSRISADGRELLRAIDAYKKQRGLARVSVDELLGVLADTGYRRA